jgi:hypothetical protein
MAVAPNRVEVEDADCAYLAQEKLKSSGGLPDTSDYLQKRYTFCWHAEGYLEQCAASRKEVSTLFRSFADINAEYQHSRRPPLRYTGRAGTYWRKKTRLSD